MTTSETDRELTIRDLYPHLSDEQLKEAEENFDRYIELELRVYETYLMWGAFALRHSVGRASEEVDRVAPSSRHSCCPLAGVPFKGIPCPYGSQNHPRHLRLS